MLNKWEYGIVTCNTCDKWAMFNTYILHWGATIEYVPLHPTPLSWSFLYFLLVSPDLRLLVSCPDSREEKGSGVTSPHVHSWASSRSVEQPIKLQGGVYWSNVEVRTSTSIHSKWCYEIHYPTTVTYLEYSTHWLHIWLFNNTVFTLVTDKGYCDILLKN